jgi:protein-L-isoaspartate(D-aspartate) O-methyltransferase
MKVDRLEEMLRTIDVEARATAFLTGRSSFAPRVMEAFEQVPRTAFVPPELIDYAYENRPLPIGRGQTISQPYIVALMTDLLEPRSNQTVLEVGTGSGYQAAILAQLVQHVYSLEIMPLLAVEAASLLARLGYANISVKTGNGHIGWPEHAPYDGIIITAAATYLSPALLDQLKPGGRLVVPFGRPHMTQDLMLIEKDIGGKLHSRKILDVAFVPMMDEDHDSSITHGEG